MIQVNLPFLMSNCQYLQIYLILVFSKQDVTSPQNILDFLIWELKWQIENLAWFREWMSSKLGKSKTDLQKLVINQ